MSRRYADKIHPKAIKRLVELRKSKGISQLILAQASGVSRQAIGLIESGKRNPSLFVCLSIANELGVRLSDVLDDIEK